MKCPFLFYFIGVANLVLNGRGLRLKTVKICQEGDVFRYHLANSAAFISILGLFRLRNLLFYQRPTSRPGSLWIRRVHINKSLGDLFNAAHETSIGRCAGYTIPLFIIGKIVQIIIRVKLTPAPSYPD